MKNPLKPALTVAKRWFALYRITDLEIQIDGMTEAISRVKCPMTRAHIDVARHHARISLAVSRAEYNSLHPVGQRRTWQTA